MATFGGKVRCCYDGQRVLLETDDSDNDERAFVYGNYIDEVLIMTDYTAQDDPDYYYGHDHLYSTVVIFDEASDVYERAEYNAYGEVQLLSPNYEPRTTSLCNNPYYFTGRRRDTLDTNGAFKIYYYRARYYDAETGRFLSRDPFGIDPAGGRINRFGVLGQYGDGMSLYRYGHNRPLTELDPYGLTSIVEYRNPGWLGHAGLLVNGKDIDFGPKDLPTDSWWDGYFGRSPYPPGTASSNAKKTTLNMRKTWHMLAGPKVGQKCCKLTLRNAAICIKYVSHAWDGSLYRLTDRNCRTFVKQAKGKCCL